MLCSECGNPRNTKAHALSLSLSLTLTLTLTLTLSLTLALVLAGERLSHFPSPPAFSLRIFCGYSAAVDKKEELTVAL